MAQINTHLDDDYFFRFKELKSILKCKRNEEALEKIIDLAQFYLQQKILKQSEPPNNKPS